MPDIKIVKLNPDDWRLYRQIRLESLQAEPQAYSSSFGEVSQRPDSHWQERLIETQQGSQSWLLFAKENDRIIGMVGAYRSVTSGVVEIISLYVTIRNRQKGAGRALLEAILAEISQASDIRKACLTVNSEQAAAVALYRESGFQVTGETGGVMGDGKYYPGYFMEKQVMSIRENA